MGPRPGLAERPGAGRGSLPHAAGALHILESSASLSREIVTSRGSRKPTGRSSSRGAVTAPRPACAAVAARAATHRGAEGPASARGRGCASAAGGGAEAATSAGYPVGGRSRVLGGGPPGLPTTWGAVVLASSCKA